jgi:hypothetical protein
MQGFKNILVVIDPKTDSGALIERAVTLGQRNQARLTIVTVAEEFPPELPTPVAVPSTGVEAPAIDIIEEFSLWNICKYGNS